MSFIDGIRKSLRSVKSPIVRLAVLRDLEEHYSSLQKATDARERRQEWIKRIKLCTENGRVALCHWSRDCDQVEGTSRTVVLANVKLIDQLIDETLMNAEGPVNHWIQRPSETFIPMSRDRALEALEDGRGNLFTI